MTTGKLISIGRHEIAEDGFSHAPSGDTSMMRSYTFVDGAFVKMTVDAMHECDVLSSREVRIVSADAFDMTAHLNRQIDWARETFGPGPRTAALTDHIRKELAEIAESPSDTREWLDVVILALEGAMRTGVSPANICTTLTAMQERNEARKWADWRTAPPGVASEHDRTAECKSSKAPPGYRELVLCGSEGRGYVTAPNGDSVAVDGDWSAAWTHYDAHGRTAPPGAAIEHERTVECKRVNVTPIYGWSRGRFPSDDLPRELAAAGVKEWDYHSMCPDSAMVYVDSEADGEAVARAVWRGILLSQKTSGNSFYAYVDDGGGRHVVRFSRIPAAEDRSKPPLGYRLIHGCDGFSFADHEGGHHAAAMHNLGHGWRQDAALVNAWAHHDARTCGGPTTAEDRSKPPPGYRLALECYGFVFYAPDGRRGRGCGWRHGDALVEAWLDYDACAHGSTPR